VDLGGAEDGAPLCGGVRRTACHITPPSNSLSLPLTHSLTPCKYHLNYSI
jgi:hypothetical protein